MNQSTSSHHDGYHDSHSIRLLAPLSYNVHLSRRGDQSPTTCKQVDNESLLTRCSDSSNVRDDVVVEEERKQVGLPAQLTQQWHPANEKAERLDDTVTRRQSANQLTGERDNESNLFTFLVCSLSKYGVLSVSIKDNLLMYGSIGV